MKRQIAALAAGGGFWVEPDGSDSVKVGVVNNREAGHVEAELRRLREVLRAQSLRARFTGRGVFLLLRVYA